MTKTTKNLKLPYPDETDIPDGAAQMKALAERLDAITNIFGYVAGPPTLSIPAGGAATPIPVTSLSQVGGFVKVSDTEITCPQDGMYLVCGTGSFTTMPAGAYSTWQLLVDGTTGIWTDNVRTNYNTGNFLIQLTAGQKLQAVSAIGGSSTALELVEPRFWAIYAGTPSP